VVLRWGSLLVKYIALLQGQWKQSLQKGISVVLWSAKRKPNGLDFRLPPISWFSDKIW
jgi:hypothetical protein